MEAKVVIIGVSFSSRLALARAIGVLGCDITIIAWASSDKVRKPVDGYSKYVSRVLICKKEENAFIRLLKEKCIDHNHRVILVPDCDFSVSIVDQHQDELRPFFLFPNINGLQGAIVEWSDKLRQKKLAEKIGMNVVGSSVVEIKDAKYTVPDNIKYPCFPKALVSVAGGKAGMFRCDNELDLNRALQDIITRKKVNAKVMIEDYMEIEKEYAALGVSDGVHVSIPGIIQFTVGSKTQRGIALQGRIIPVHGFEDIIEMFKEYIMEIGLTGLFDIDFYQSNGKLYFSELNIRYGGSGYAVVKLGVNLPAMFIQSMMSIDNNDWSKLVEKEAVFTNERIALNDLSNGLITSREYKEYVNSAEILFIEDCEDPEPFKEFHRIQRRSSVKSIIKRMIRWQ